MDPLHYYKGRVTFVVEGNLYDVVVDTGFFLTIRVPVELKGLSIPSTKSRLSEERVLGRAAKDAAMEILLDKWIYVETFKEAHRPRIWNARIYLDAESGRPGVTKEVFGRQLIDLSAYMNALKEEDFDPRGIELRYAKRAKRGRKAAA